MRIIRLKDVQHSTGLGRSTIYKYISEEAFQNPCHWATGLSAGLKVR